MPGRAITVVADAAAPSETFIRREVAGLRQLGWNVELAGLRGDLPRVPRVRNVRRVPASAVWEQIRAYLPLQPWQALAVLRATPRAARLAALARAGRMDLVHAHFAWLPADVGALAARLADVPWVCSVHAWDVFTQDPRLVRHRLCTAAAVLACSEAAAAAVRAAGVAAARVWVVRHGLPLDEYAFKAERAGSLLLAVGRLEPKKGFDTFVRACAQLRAADVPVTGELIGAGSQRAVLAGLIRRLGLEGTVRLAGALPPEAVRERMQHARALVLPSRRLPSGDRDGVANVLVEAMALGTPVVTTLAGAAGELVQTGESGLLVPPDDPASLVRALAGLLAEPDRAAALARAGRAAVERLHDGRQTIRQLDALLSEVGGQRSEGGVES